MVPIVITLVFRLIDVGRFVFAMLVGSFANERGLTDTAAPGIPLA
jgi:hypothetical protein